MYIPLLGVILYYVSSFSWVDAQQHVTLTQNTYLY